MKRLSALFGTALLVLLAAAASQVRADYLNWTYTTSSSVPGISVDTTAPSGGASVSLTGFKTAQSSGTSIPVIAYETSTSSTTPIAFDNSTYTLALKITDPSTGDSGKLDFTGALNGSLSATSSSVVNTFTPVASNSLTLDGHTYTVSIPKATLAAPTSTQQDILANVTVSNGSSSPPPPPPPPPSSGDGGDGTGGGNTPEPASLVLGSLGFSCFGIGCWWKRRRRPSSK